MNVCFIGDARLYVAVDSLCCQIEGVALQQSTIDTIDTVEEFSFYHFIILDSKWFREFGGKSITISVDRVVVIGPYVDSFSRSSFTPSPQYTYIAYSELEAKLIPLLNSIIASVEEPSIRR